MHSPNQHPTPTGAPAPPTSPSTAPKRPKLGKRARTTRAAPSDTWNFDTRRGYSHYNQSAPVNHLPKPAAPAASRPHVQAQTHTLYNPAFLQTPYVPAISALPAIAAEIQSIRKWHARAVHLTPQANALGREHAILRQYLSRSGPAAQNRSNQAQLALSRLLAQHADNLALRKAAVVRAVSESSTKTASACCELFTFLLVPLPAVHAFLGVEAGTKLMRPYTTFIIPAAFLVTAGLQIAHFVERLEQAWRLWLASQQAAVGATGANRGALKLPALGDASLPNALMRECIYTACQLFFWTAFACGMSAASGSMFVGLISPSIAIVCLMVGVIGTTAMHMGWANAYATPDRIDDATPEDFGSLSERRQKHAALSEEAKHIETFRLTCAAYLPPIQASVFQAIVPVLENLTQTSVVTDWVVNRWFARTSDRVGSVVTAHLQRLSQTRLAYQTTAIEQMSQSIAQMDTDEGQACLAALPTEVQALANRALSQQRQQLESFVAARDNLLRLSTELEHDDAAQHWQKLTRDWLCDEHEHITEQQVSDRLYQLLISEPAKDIYNEKIFLTWMQRVALTVRE